MSAKRPGRIPVPRWWRRNAGQQSDLGLPLPSELLRTLFLAGLTLIADAVLGPVTTPACVLTLAVAALLASNVITLALRGIEPHSRLPVSRAPTAA